MTAAIIQIDDLVKDYRGLRPLRVLHLRVGEAERVAVMGLDAAAAETLVNLITGAHLPDRGSVHVLGESTAGIANADAWLSFLDRFGIVSERAALLDAMTVAQNLALPFALDIDPIPPHTQHKITAVARDVGLDASALNVRLAEAGPLTRARVNLGRAVALAPSLLILEHSTARLADREVPTFAGDVVRVAAARSLAVVALTADVTFARGIGGRLLTWEARTGELREKKGWWRDLRI